MRMLTWNIQASRGCDGRFDLPRITDHIKQYDDLDVICLQELARNIPDQNTNDQLSEMAQHFTEYTPVWAPGFSFPNLSDLDGTPSEFGNLTLVKKAILRNSRTHILPSPAVQDLQMSRTMVETVITQGDFHLTLFNAHLAFHSNVERIEQIKALTRLRDQILSKTLLETDIDSVGPYQYVDASAAVILCGDLNVSLGTEEFKTHVVDQQWLDCWTLQPIHTDTPTVERQPTCGCFDHIQWPEGAHVRDYFLASENMANNIISVTVDVDTDASDHQPVLLEVSL